MPIAHTFLRRNQLAVGVVVLIVLLILLFSVRSSSAVLTIMMLLFILGGWFALLAPAPCLALTRKGQRCRNNSRGLMGGCHIIQHRQMTFVKRVLDDDLPTVGNVRSIAWNMVMLLGSVGSFAGGLVAVILYFADRA